MVERPARCLLAHALVDQHVGVDRHAHGQHDAGDAGQRQRRAERRQDADHQEVVGDQRDVGEEAEEAVADDHEDGDADGRHDRGDDAGADRVGAEARADRALLDDGQLGRQRAGAQQDGEVVGALHGEAAADLAGAAEDRLADHRRRDHLVVEHDGEGLADILAGDVAELPRAAGRQAEVDHRLVGALIEAGLRVGRGPRRSSAASRRRYTRRPCRPSRER